MFATSAVDGMEASRSSSLLPATLLLLLGLLLSRRACSSPPPDAVFPRTEAELVAAVAAAAAARRKVKAAPRHSHSFPKLACPGGRNGTIISTARLNRTVSVDTATGLMTVEGGIVLRDLIRDAATAGLALPHSPYWYGVSIVGLLATGAHGSLLWGKGAVHEYVVGMRIVTPAPASQGFAVVRELGADHPDLDAAKVSLGVLGVASQVTLQLQPMFKRSVTFLERDASDLGAQVAMWGNLHEFGDMTWLPRQGKVIYREDDRVDVSSPGDGLNDYLGFRSFPTIGLITARVAEEHVEDSKDMARCLAAGLLPATFPLQAYGFTNDGSSFTGYPVVGYQHRIQVSGSCIDAKDNLLRSSRVRSPFFYNSGFSVALSKASALVADMQRLRDLNPCSLCSLEAKMGVLIRYVGASSAYLGKTEDSVDFDFTYYRSYTQGRLRAHSDVIDELEQMALHKYGAVPQWGKNRNSAFDGAIAKYAKADEFLKVKERYDPDGVFSSEWSDHVLGIDGSPNIIHKGCAIEGLCICSHDSHCAPEQGYYCRPGKVYAEARVCSFQPTSHRDHNDEI
ncbi:L-gulonolactone oxidase 5-like isoform X2 [Triticum aestivum]|uniref:L-gulonolactone oxidase 5-like isoform X2 n=1 Tax=Triticum aestivum TaxID=4565 RepID=UPI001D00A18C|nr:L-gulonolactone oxidase 5-like isoform X2 [Triticum aestivum]